jgi:ketosteroid isomerase-like protein
VRVTLLGTDHALAVGSFSLEGVTAFREDHTGVCSLILHKTARGWRISADHTS